MRDSGTTALFCTFCCLAGGIAHQDVRMVSYKSRQAFMRLWGANGTADSGARVAGLRGVVQDLVQAGVNTLVVVWDGTRNLATGPVDTTCYLTPLDWVMALSCELESDDGDFFGLSVWILPFQPIGGIVSETEEFVNSLPEDRYRGPLAAGLSDRQRWQRSERTTGAGHSVVGEGVSRRRDERLADLVSAKSAAEYASGIHRDAAAGQGGLDFRSDSSVCRCGPPRRG